MRCYMLFRLIPMCIMLLPLAVRAQAAGPSGRLVTVSAGGRVTAVPDEAVIKLSITTENDDLLQVRADNDRRARALLQMLNKHGGGPKEFQATRLDISLRYDEDRAGLMYRVDRDIEIAVRDLTRLDPLLADILQHGGYKVSSIEFQTTKYVELLSEARRQAVLLARKQASHLAELNGLKLGKAWNINERYETQTPFVTSVIPVVGKAMSGHDDREIVRLDTTKNGQTILPAKKTTTQQSDFHLVGFAQQKVAKDNNVPASPSGDQPFALGRIDVSATVVIEFELIEIQGGR